MKYKFIKENRFVVLLSMIVIVVVLMCRVFVNQLNRDNHMQEKEQLEQAIKRSVVACYATEGIYPPDVNYIEEHYGIRIDESRYTVIYEIFAQNLMPDVTVLDNYYEE